jgi:hypothetical protein
MVCVEMVGRDRHERAERTLRHTERPPSPTHADAVAVRTFMRTYAALGPEAASFNLPSLTSGRAQYFPIIGACGWVVGYAASHLHATNPDAFPSVLAVLGRARDGAVQLLSPSRDESVDIDTAVLIAENVWTRRWAPFSLVDAYSHKPELRRRLVLGHAALCDQLLDLAPSVLDQHSVLWVPAIAYDMQDQPGVS